MSIIGMRTKMSKYLKWLVLAIAASFAIGFIAMTISPGSQGPAPTRTDTGVLAKVNGEKLMWQDFQSIVNMQEQQYEAMGRVGPASEIQLRGSIFDDMVNESMWVQAAKKEGVRVSRGDIRKKIDEYTDEQMKTLRENYLKGKKQKTDKVFEVELGKAEKGMTIKKKRAEIRKQFASISDKIGRSLMIEKLNKKIEDSVDVSDRALEESYDSANLSQITVATIGKRSDEQAKKRAEEIVAKLKKGDDFAAVARESSDDQYKEFGGNRGPVQRLMIEPELKDVAFKLDVNEISDPVKTADGYVILKSAGVMHNVPPDFNDKKKKAEYKETFAQRARETARTEYEAKLRKELKLEILDPELKAYVAFNEGSRSLMTLDNPGKQKMIENVVKLYEEAVASAGDRSDIQARCYYQLGTLYGIMGAHPMFGYTPEQQAKYKKQAVASLRSVLDYTEDNGVRLALARMLIDAKDIKGVEESLKVASENAYNEVRTHEQIRDMYKEIKRADLAAQEQQWIDNYNKEQAASGSGAVTSGPIRVPGGGQ